MRITPKLALTTTAVLLAIGLLWVGFVEGGRGQTTVIHGSGTSAQYPHQFINQNIAAEIMAASAVPGVPQTGASPAARHPQDNVPVLALSGTVIAGLVMLALAFARFQAVHPAVRPAVRPETPTPRRTRLVTSGPPQL